MDLTNSYPASPKAKIAGVVFIARTIDKAKATADGDIGEYHYDCPLDQYPFEFLGFKAPELLETVKNAKSDGDIESFVQSYASKKSPDEIAAFNKKALAMAPEPGSEGEAYFMNLRKEIAPERTDVTTWPDLLDLDEKRDVPKHTS